MCAGHEASKWPQVWSLRGPLHHSPYPGIQEEALMALWRDYPAPSGPQPPPTLLLKLCPGRQLPSPTTPAPCQMNTLSLMLKPSLLSETPSPKCPRPSATDVPTVVLSHMPPWDHPFMWLQILLPNSAPSSKKKGIKEKTLLPNPSLRGVQIFPPLLSSLRNTNPLKTSLSGLSIDHISVRRPNPQVCFPPDMTL